ncbi:MAG TPA: PAS domain S-box protein [Candidatus Limnocylindrales bacterium]|jgi:PAS domain S-box-containing protein|nr:PAS domain S-box protein [Candidatus Limnocylindrales bacterium]
MAGEPGGTPLLERQLAVQYAIARAFAEADQLEEIAGLVLQPLAEALGWQAASVWVRARDGSLRCAAIYSVGGALDEWAADAAGRRFEVGEGVPGRVWVSAAPIWVSDTDRETEFPRRQLARQVGLRHGFCFPIHVRGTVRAVVELFGGEVREVDQAQAEFLQAVGHQLGSFMERIEARRAVGVSEARKAGILDAAIDAIVSADREGRIVEFNAAAEELFGRRRSDVVGRRIADILVPEDLRPAHEAGLRRYLETGAPRILGQRVRTHGRRADESRFPIELTVTEARIEGDPMFTAFIRDITREREAETARDRFLEILSHELRTPVTAIYGGAKVLARRASEGPHEELVRDIGEEADRLYRLVEDLIVLARAERGALAMSLEPVRLERVTERVVEAFRLRSPELRFELSVHGMAGPVMGDETYVEQLLRNLLSNAVKYGAAGGEIEVRIDHGDTESALRVLDRGVGIDAAEARRLFEIDYRSPLTEGLAHGSGIGLFVARWLIEGMGGRIWATRREGGGSEFGFALRTVDAEALLLDAAGSEPPTLPVDSLGRTGGA